SPCDHGPSLAACRPLDVVDFNPTEGTSRGLKECRLSSIIRVSAVVMRDPEGRILNVRKRGTAKLMLPGGKPHPGEDARDTAIREFEEELGVALSSVQLRSVGVFTTH